MNKFKSALMKRTVYELEVERLGLEDLPEPERAIRVYEAYVRSCTHILSTDSHNWIDANSEISGDDAG